MGMSKSPQRFSMMDTSQTEKNILNMNQVKFQPGAVAQAQSGTQAHQNSTGPNNMTLNSAAGQITEYENAADKENKYKQKFNMRMSKYGHNQFRPSAVINSVA